MSSAVAMSKMTPPAPAGAVNVTLKVNVCVPLAAPSNIDTSPMLSVCACAAVELASTSVAASAARADGIRWVEIICLKLGQGAVPEAC